MSCEVEEARGLPPVLRAVVRALGFDRASKWLASQGGLDVTLPKYKTRALGLSDAELARLRLELAPHLKAGDRVTLPKPDKLFRRIRNERLRAERTRKTVSALVVSYGLTGRQIRNICREEADDRQFSLF
uniref:Mor transcription activator family protein n=1 Tax=Candidatus Kentrum sp. LFY TaxID=2126342 RepID=A0A450UE76_9GAMM|nr:MAG: hypothetical protein BECKLFY1418A_GA0070994_101336 [Candidatus Kentron sp. LFY]